MNAKELETWTTGILNTLDMLQKHFRNRSNG